MRRSCAGLAATDSPTTQKVPRMWYWREQVQHRRRVLRRPVVERQREGPALVGGAQDGPGADGGRGRPPAGELVGAVGVAGVAGVGAPDVRGGGERGLRRCRPARPAGSPATVSPAGCRPRRLAGGVADRAGHEPPHPDGRGELRRVAAHPGVLVVGGVAPLLAAGGTGSGPPGRQARRSTTARRTAVTSAATRGSRTWVRAGAALHTVSPAAVVADTTKCRSLRVPAAAKVAYTVATSATATG